MPLLHPQHHSLPFALTLELHARQPERYGDTAKPPRPPQLDPSVFALHYVLAGSGKLVRAGGSEQLQAGDAVLMQSGAAACCVADGDDEEEDWRTRQPSDGSEAPAWHLAELVAYMPQELFRQPRQQTGQVPLLAAASLQPLLQHASTEVGALPDSMARELLAGAKATARQALLGGEVPGAQQDGSSSSGDEDGSSNSSSSSAGGSGDRLLPFFQSAANSLAGWWQQQQDRTCPVTKRTLAELTAFQMPGQTNRLAVQFDPFSRPEVPFISGIEVRQGSRELCRLTLQQEGCLCSGSQHVPCCDVHTCWSGGQASPVRLCAATDPTPAKETHQCSLPAHHTTTLCRCLSGATTRSPTCTRTLTSCSSYWPARAPPFAAASASPSAPATWWCSALGRYTASTTTPRPACTALSSWYQTSSLQSLCAQALTRDGWRRMTCVCWPPLAAGNTSRLLVRLKPFAHHINSPSLSKQMCWLHPALLRAPGACALAVCVRAMCTWLHVMQQPSWERMEPFTGSTRRSAVRRGSSARPNKG